MRIRSTDDISLAVYDFGGSGTPLLLSHATGFLGHCYLPMADALADHHRCWALDYRGHGDTPSAVGLDPDEPVDWNGYGDDALAAAAELAPDGGLIGFGHSMGGTALLMAAARRPELFAALVLFEPIVYDRELAPKTATIPISEAARRRRESFESFESAIENYTSKPPFNALDPDVTRMYVAHGFRPAPEGIRLKCAPAYEAATFEGGRFHECWELLPDIQVPVTVAYGNETAGPAVFAPATADRLPNSTLVQVDGDHFYPLADPAGCAELVLTATR